MKELIQNNITPKDLAYDVKLRIEFVKGISEQNLLTIESKLNDKILKEVKVGFGSAIGIDFIEAAILNFGNESKFELLKKCINDVLIPYQELIEQISFRKSEFTQSTYEFASEQQYPIQKIYEHSLNVFGTLNFQEISDSKNSPEAKHFSGIDSEESLRLYVSQFNYQAKSWIRISVGCKRLKNEEIGNLLKKVNLIHPNSKQIKWNRFEYNHVHKIWEAPKNYKLFEELETKA